MITIMGIEIAQVKKIHLFGFNLYCIFYNTYSSDLTPKST